MMNKEKNFMKMLLLVFTIVQIGTVAHVVFASDDVSYVNELTEGLQEPIDTAVGLNGNVYVLDRQLSKVLVYSSQGQYQFTFAEQGSFLGQFEDPNAISVSPNGDVIVADTGNARVQMFNAAGEFLRQIGRYGKNPGEFQEPDSLAIDGSGNIYVGDSKSKTITKFSPEGRYLEHRRLTFMPTDLVFDLKENLYVLLPTIGRIIKYDLQTKDYDQITIKENGENPIVKAVDISVDNNGHIYLVEAASHSIKKIDQNKTLLLSYGSKGDGKGQFNWPAGVTSDRTGRIYVADAMNKRVQVLANVDSSLSDQLPADPSPSLQIASSAAEQRVYLTKISRPLDLINAPDRIVYAISKDMILEEIKAELSFTWGMKKDALSHFIQVEAEERLGSGQIKLTVSIPKEIPLESSVILSRM